jgi:hypothetical protein
MLRVRNGLRASAQRDATLAFDAEMSVADGMFMNFMRVCRFSEPNMGSNLSTCAESPRPGDFQRVARSLHAR